MNHNVKFALRRFGKSVYAFEQSPYCVSSVQLRCVRQREGGYRLSMDGSITRLTVVALLACLHAVSASVSAPSPTGKSSLRVRTESKKTCEIAHL